MRTKKRNFRKKITKKNYLQKANLLIKNYWKKKYLQ